jgi:DNA-binding response OmpR family regulator
MRILVADDDDISRIALKLLLNRRGYEVIEAADGATALELLLQPDAPGLAVLDWLMPGMDGVEICRQARTMPALGNLYIVLLTSRGGQNHVIEGLQAGANDYVTKPFDRDELLARIDVGVKVVQLQTDLALRVRELEEAMQRVQQLQGLLPICSYCKSIRDDQRYWHQVDAYLSAHADLAFSHGICPSCWDDLVRPSFEAGGVATSAVYAG